MEQEVVMRSLPFDSALYQQIMDEAKDEDRTFPRQVMWMLKKYFEAQDSADR